MLDEIDLAALADPAAYALILQLLNLVDQHAGQLCVAHDEIQRLHDEVAQSWPKTKPQALLPATSLSSEAERCPLKKRQPRGKPAQLTIIRQGVCGLECATLPLNA